MRLVHLTDPHLTSLSEGQLPAIRGKRRLGYWSWKRKRQFRHRRELLQRITTAVLEEQASQILISGDLAQIGLPEEIATARQWLESLGPPERVALVPGNHDYYRADSWSALSDQWADYLGLDRSGSGTARRARPAGHAADAKPVPGRQPCAGPLLAFPWQRRLDGPGGGITVIGLCSAYPAPLLLADGRLGAAQLGRLDGLLSCAPGFRCLILHHPPLPGMAPWRKALRDAKQLRRLIVQHRPELVLHGHLHRNQEGPELAPTRIFATASASSAAAKAAASYRVFDIEPVPSGTSGQDTEEAWSVVMRLKGLTAGSQLRVLQESAWQVPVRRPASTP